MVGSGARPGEARHRKVIEGHALAMACPHHDLNLLGGATAILVSDVSRGTLNLQSNGGFTYTPAAAYLGTDTFRYRPSGVLSTAATVTIEAVSIIQPASQATCGVLSRFDQL